MFARRLMVGALLLGAAAAGHADPADLLLYNGQVLTVVKAFSIHKAVAVKDGRILAVGGDDLAKRYQAPVRTKAKELGPGEWVTGYGWAETNLVEKRNVVRADLDAAAPDNPVALSR